MGPERILRLGTRGSPLARWQADWVARRLTQLAAHVEIVLIPTQGDIRTGPIGTLSGQGVFTKEIQRSLLSGDIDLAVHSLKDLPTEEVNGLILAAVPPRERSGDVLITGVANNVESLPRAARVGTGSARRRAQLLHIRSDLQMVDIRGNVESRIRKLEEGECDALVLAEAGVLRLELWQHVTCVVPRSIMLPAVGQGALAIETRADDADAATFVRQLDDPQTRMAVTAERSMMAHLHGGCLAPVGAWARIESNRLLLDGVVLSADGRQRVTASAAGSCEDAAGVGLAVANKLLELGAAELIGAARRL